MYSRASLFIFVFKKWLEFRLIKHTSSLQSLKDLENIILRFIRLLKNYRMWLCGKVLFSIFNDDSKTNIEIKKNYTAWYSNSLYYSPFSFFFSFSIRYSSWYMHLLELYEKICHYPVPSLIDSISHISQEKHKLKDYSRFPLIAFSWNFFFIAKNTFVQDTKTSPSKVELSYTLDPKIRLLRNIKCSPYLLFEMQRTWYALMLKHSQNFASSIHAAAITELICAPLYFTAVRLITQPRSNTYIYGTITHLADSLGDFALVTQLNT